MAATVVGLDIGSTAVRGVELNCSTKGGPTLLRFHEVPLPANAVSKGEVLNPDVVKSALKRLWSEGKFKSKNVVLGTGNQSVLVRELSVPKMTLKGIRETLPFHVQSALQMTLEDSILDFYPTSETVGDQGVMVKGLLIAADKEAILGNIRVTERAGLTPVEVDLIPFALNRLLTTRAKIKGTVALIDVGATTTSIIIVGDGVPLFVRIIPAGGGDLTQALESSLDINNEAAEKLKRALRVGADLAIKEDFGPTTTLCTCPKCQSDLGTADDPRVSEILQRITGELLGSLRNTVSYFNNTHPEDFVSQIILTGGGAQLSGFPLALNAMVQIPVTVADPFANISLAHKLENQNFSEKNPSLSVAMGLALRTLS